ncbi:MAG: hypothetical protein KatS3mg057_1263 [Herpetosiphonaceae bacterium]|nr:MAG: hypothetical protein KatS3mg057_1263 [Herpetosiphonaceae bacterium]
MTFTESSAFGSNPVIYSDTVYLLRVDYTAWADAGYRTYLHGFDARTLSETVRIEVPYLHKHGGLMSIANGVAYYQPSYWYPDSGVPYLF